MLTRFRRFGENSPALCGQQRHIRREITTPPSGGQGARERSNFVPVH